MPKIAMIKPSGYNWDGFKGEYEVTETSPPSRDSPEGETCVRIGREEYWFDNCRVEYIREE